MSYRETILIVCGSSYPVFKMSMSAQVPGSRAKRVPQNLTSGLSRGDEKPRREQHVRSQVEFCRNVRVEYLQGNDYLEIVVRNGKSQNGDNRNLGQHEL